MVDKNTNLLEQSTCILIPALNPDENLSKLIIELKKRWALHGLATEPSIVIVNDGSWSHESVNIFENLFEDANVVSLANTEVLASIISSTSELRNHMSAVFVCYDVPHEPAMHTDVLDFGFCSKGGGGRTNYIACGWYL